MSALAEALVAAQAEGEALVKAGDALAQRLREVQDEYGPEEVGNDLGWASVEVALSQWIRAKKGTL